MGLIAQGPLFATSVAPPNIMLLFDDSGSMRISAGSVSRMTAAKQAAINLLDGLHNVRVGIASFGHPSKAGKGATINYGIADLDDNRDEIYAAINALSAGGGTPISEALHEVGRYFVGLSGPENTGGGFRGSMLMVILHHGGIPAMELLGFTGKELQQMND
jgi:hypothetical protein